MNHRFQIAQLPLTIPFFLATTRLSLNKKKAKACVGAEVMKVTQKGADSSAQLSPCLDGEMSEIYLQVSATQSTAGAVTAH